MIRIQILLISFLFVCVFSGNVQQYNSQKLAKAINENQYTLVYFYSATCNYCKEFTPVFQKIQKDSPYPGIVYGKIDGQAHQAVSKKYEIFSYPSLALFWKGIDEPIFHRRQRTLQEVTNFLKFRIEGLRAKIEYKQYEKLNDQAKSMAVIYHGEEYSKEFNVTSVLSYVQKYRAFTRVLNQSVQKPYLQIKGQNYADFDVQKIKNIIRVKFAEVHLITEQSWTRIHENRQPGIVFVNTKNNKETLQLLEKLAPEYPHVIFLQVDPSQDQFTPALDAFGIQRQESILGVNELAHAKFMAQQPYTEESIKAFIKGVIDLSLPVYRKTQKSSKNKLTRSNFEEKMAEKKDKIIFFYKTSDKNSKKFMELFKTLTNQLYENQNLSMLRCNLQKNEVQDLLELRIDHTPNILFFRNKMRDHPIYFSSSTISAQSVIQFIMENTTFDWQDQWGQL